MTTITETLTDPTEQPIEGVAVTIQVAGDGGRPVPAAYAADGTLVNRFRTETDDAGVWSVDLPANENLTPAGTAYRVILTGKRVDSTPRYVTVPSTTGPHDVFDILTDPPGAVASSALAAHQSDENAHPELAEFYVSSDVVQVDEDNSNAVIVAGVDNEIVTDASRDTDPKASHLEGFENRAFEWYAHVEGAGSIVDGKISHAEGNATVCSANDAHAEGNLTVAGRRYFDYTFGSAITTGSEDAGDGLGTLQFVLIPASEGDLTSYFPNALTDNITTRYGAGAQQDAVGNVYASGYTPATYSGETVTAANDLRWALHRVALLRGLTEGQLAFVVIEKATYSGGSGTKVYYRGAKPFATIRGIASSYSPVLLGGGNGTHAEGASTSAVGYGAHSEGYGSRAWGEAAHAEGRLTRATGQGAHAEGVSAVASGTAAHAEGLSTVASGAYSRAAGVYAIASRDFQDAFATNRRSVDGDSQISRIGYGKSCVNAGWHDVRLLVGLVNDRTYLFKSTVVGRQTAGTAGAVGNSFAYEFTGAFTTAGGSMTVLGTITRTLVGRTAGMTGDGLTTGPRLSAYTSTYPGAGIGNLVLRYDGEADTTFYIQTHTTFQELA